MAACRSRAQAAFHKIEAAYARLSIRRATAVAAVSRYTAGRIREIAGRADVHVVHNGVDTRFFRPAQAAPAQASRPFTALFVGNLTRRKGADLLPAIRAALGAGFELRFTAGLRTRLPSFLAAPAPGLVPLGRLTREGLREEYRRADALLLPSRLEGFGLAAAEAMACGKPVVCTRSSSLPELVVDGEGGRLAEMDDVAGFATALRALRDSPEKARRMGEFNRERACRLFSLEAMARSYLSIYESVLAGGEP